MSAHTNGTWRVTDQRLIDNGTGYSTVICDVLEFDRKNHPDSPEPWEADANARLIAAAPDLLAACIGLVEWAGAACSVDSRVQAARDAIAKATDAELPEKEGESWMTE